MKWHVRRLTSEAADRGNLALIFNVYVRQLFKALGGLGYDRSRSTKYRTSKALQRVAA